MNRQLRTKKIEKNIKIKTSQITWQFGGYLIQTWSDLHFTNKPLEVHNYGFTFNDNFTYHGFSTKIEQVRKKKKHTTKLRILVLYL